MKLVFHAAALADLRAIHHHISQDNPNVATAVITRIRSVLDRLTRFPRSGRRGTVEGTFEVVIPGLPYIVVYEIGDETIDIIAVFHGARDRF